MSSVGAKPASSERTKQPPRTGRPFSLKQPGGIESPRVSVIATPWKGELKDLRDSDVLADPLAWLFALANRLSVDLDAAAWRKFPGVYSTSSDQFSKTCFSFVMN